MSDESVEVYTGTDRRQHLELIQQAVARFGVLSFVLRMVAFVIATGCFVQIATAPLWRWAFIALMPLIGLWLFDAFYLRGVRLMRRLYDDVRRPASPVEAYSMDLGPYVEKVPLGSVVLSQPLIAIYGTLAGAPFLLMLAFAVVDLLDGS